MQKILKIAGQEMNLEINSCARLVESSVLATMGETTVLVTVGHAKSDETFDYFPLSVEYLEKYYASGSILGSRYIKREGFPSADAILKARMIDRAIRPLFPEDFRDVVQVIVNVMSYDENYDPIIVAINAVSVALSISKLPFSGPCGGLRVIKKDGKLTSSFATVDVDPDTIPADHMNLVASSDGTGITMVDADMNEASDEDVAKALEIVVDETQSSLDEQKKLTKEIGKEKMKYTQFVVPKELLTEINNTYKAELERVVAVGDKSDETANVNSLVQQITTELAGKFSKSQISNACELTCKSIMKHSVLEDGKRPDGRAFDEIRKLSVNVGLLKRTHGSAMFQRGNTQVVSVVTLASQRSAQLIDGMEGETTKRYMHHYNDYPFSYGESGRVSYMPGRRAIGHGALAEKALIPVIPKGSEFPYVIRVVSEILMSAGSTSMASVCGSSMSLMDAGVPIRKPVAGITVGLITDKADFSKYQLMLDIAEGEDFWGKMDFKVAGTRDGINAIQLDNKMSSIPVKILAEALEIANKGRQFVLDTMAKGIDQSRTELSSRAPRVKEIKIQKDKIGDLIGPGGKTIKGIIEATGVEIDVDQEGMARIFGTDMENVQKAEKMIDDLVGTVNPGELFEGKVVRIENYGAFVEIKGTRAGLVHVSEVADGFVKDINQYVKLGDIVKVKVVGVDEEGKIKLSMKQVAQVASDEGK